MTNYLFRNIFTLNFNNFRFLLPFERHIRAQNKKAGLRKGATSSDSDKESKSPLKDDNSKEDADEEDQQRTGDEGVELDEESGKLRDEKGEEVKFEGFLSLNN